MIQGATDKDKVFRNVIKRHRGDYFVTYRPADLRAPHATVSLTFLRPNVDVEVMKEAMEKEMEIWLKQYPVPVLVMAFNASDDFISVSSEDDKGCLFGYVNPVNGQIIRQWRILSKDELPSEQIEEKYFSRVYEELPFRRQEDVRLNAIRKAKSTGSAIRLIIFFVVGVPVLIEVISLGIDWIGYLLSGFSISIGLYKFGKAMGWIKPSQRDLVKAEKNRKMEHYYYHCEKNPETFNRLKIENFEREAVEDTMREEEAIRENSDN